MQRTPHPLSPLFILLLLVTMALPANAALKSVGPVDLVTTIPTYYQDLSNLPLQPCLDQNGMCLLPGATATTPNFDPALGTFATITTTGPISNANFPGEGFYYSAQAVMPIEAGELANLAFVLEYAYLAGVSPNTAIVFLRTDLQKMINLTPNSTYRVTHPYGTFDFTTDAQGNARGGGGVVLRQEDPAGGAGAAVGYLTPDMKAATNTNIGPFLVPADGILLTRTVGTEIHTYIGDAATAVPVTGGPNGNIFKIDRIITGGTPKSAQTSWQTNLFVLMGRVFTGTVASPMTIDRATYAQDASGGQVDIFVTAQQNATLQLSGTGIPTGNMTPDTPATGKFFSHIPFTGSTLPSGLSITNSLDLPTPIHNPLTLVDEVNISQATYNPVTNAVTIKAASRDRVALPTLTVPQLAAPNTLDATGTLVKTLPANGIPPLTVTVASSRGGLATAPVSVIIPPAAPVAADDTASTITTAAVTIPVLLNDTTAATLDPASIAPSAAVGGTVVANANGTVTFTPAAAFTGAASFTYTVKDTFGQTSNVATVTVTVTSPVVAPATGVTLFSTVASPQIAGTAVAFNAAAVGGSGNYEYQYWLRDSTGTFTLVQPFSASPTWNWNTTGLVAGTYSIAVQARSVGSTSPNGFDAENVTDFFVIGTIGATIPATAVTITPNFISPQPAGTPVVFTGTASGGSGFYEYQFWLKDTTGVYTLVQPFSTRQSWTWNTTGAAPGTYAIAVQARSVGTSPNGFNVENTTTFDIQ